ncbi:MAG: hypothetical protein Q4P16_02990 [Spirochaetales bacterium]|nr:hypothetical protein [Spirochaetales bacterium]
MGRIGKHLKAEIEDYIEQVIETRLNYKQTAFTFAPSGDDSPPIKDDRIILVSIDGNGKFAAVGVLTASQGAKPGEKILYSRNEDGEVQAVLSLLNDGKVKLETPEEVSLAAEKDLKAESKANVEVTTAQKMTLKAQETELTGGILKCKGTASPNGQGPFCAIPVCPFSGALQCGSEVSGT